MSLWTSGGTLLVNGDGNLIECDDCPCGDPVDTPCDGSCPVGGDTATATITIDGVPFTVTLTVVIGPYSYYFGSIDCGDGYLDVGLACNPSSYNVWAFTATLRFDGLPNASMAWDAHPPTSLSCSPYHAHFSGNNTFSDGSGTICGVTVGAVGTVSIVADIVT